MRMSNIFLNCSRVTDEQAILVHYNTMTLRTTIRKDFKFLYMREMIRTYTFCRFFYQCCEWSQGDFHLSSLFSTNIRSACRDTAPRYIGESRERTPVELTKYFSENPTGTRFIRKLTHSTYRFTVVKKTAEYFLINTNYSKK
jgi:hypothetical protein